MFKRLVACLLSMSILGLQISYADTLTGSVLNDIGTGGANITGSTGGFTGFNTDGTNASLNFSGDATINWGNLNIGREQSLHFLNGSHSVLNNVTGGMSTFAGLIKGDSGAIIISNPNGMLLNNGTFETSGAAITLTTKNLIDKYSYEDSKLKIDWDNARFLDDNYSIISLSNVSKIAGGDINIISKGISIQNSDITSSGNISLTTSDGANFVAHYTPSAANGNTQLNNYPILIAKSSVKSNGNVVLKSDNDIGLYNNDKIQANNTNVNGQYVMNSSNKFIKNEGSSVGGNLDIKGTQIEVYNTVVEGDATLEGSRGVYTNYNAPLEVKFDVGGTLKVKSGQANINNATANNLILDTTIGNATIKNSTIKNNANITTKGVTFIYNLKVGTDNDVNATGLLSVKANGYADVRNTSGKSANIQSDNNVTISDTNTYTGDFTAISKGANAENGSVIIGNTQKLGDIEDGKFVDTVLSANNINLQSDNGNVGLAGVLNANNVINITASSGAILSAINSIDSSKNILNAKDCNLIANSNIYNINPTATRLSNGNIGLDFTQAVKGREKASSTSGLTIKANNLDVKIKSADINIKTPGTGIKLDAEIANNVNMKAENSTLFLKDSIIKSPNGQVRLKAKKDVVLEGNNITTSKFQNGVITNNSDNTININENAQGGLIAKSTGLVQIGWTNKNDFSDNEISNNTITGDVALSSGDSKVSVDHSTINGDVYAEGKNTFYTNNTINGNSTFDAKQKAQVDVSLLNGDLAMKTSQNSSSYYMTIYGSDIMGDAFLDSASKIELGTKSGSNINSTINGEAKLITLGNINSDANFGDVIIANANDATFDSANQLSFLDSNIKGKFEANSSSDVTLDNSNFTNSSDANITGKNITSNDSSFGGNTNMTATGNVTLTGTNTVNNSLNANSTNNGDVKISGSSTTIGDNLNITTKGNAVINNIDARNGAININDAYNISVSNAIADSLGIIDPIDGRFNVAQIYNTFANSTEFRNGLDLYLDLGSSSLYGNNLQSILNNTHNVDRIHISPVEAIWGQEATKTINTYQAQGTSSVIGSSFTPIAFAANEKNNKSIIKKKIGDAVYKDSEQIVHVTERFNLDD